MGPFRLPEDKQEAEQEALQFHPEDWGMKRSQRGLRFHFPESSARSIPGRTASCGIVLQLDGEEIVDLVPEIGFHHRGAEKMGERQSWHTYIPYTDRVDYLGGVMNNLRLSAGVEKLAGIEVPARAQVIRVMLCELFRIISHLVWYGTFAQDVGQMSPVFYTFNDRERAFGIIEAICGARMHPNWFRIGGVAQDLPKVGTAVIRDFMRYLPPRLKEYDREVMQNRIFQARTKGIGVYSLDEAIDWGVTGPNLRSCGFEWDFRKKQPYSGYEQFRFRYSHRDSTAIAMTAQLFAWRKCARAYASSSNASSTCRTARTNLSQPLGDASPEGSHDARHRDADHSFSERRWGPGAPPGEALGAIEATKGNNGYYLVSDGSTNSYRTRIRTPSFAHMQTLPLLCRGLMIPGFARDSGQHRFRAGRYRSIEPFEVFAREMKC